MWKLMEVYEKTGIELSESLSMLPASLFMMPASSVSALVFAHKESQYFFAVGQITKNQVDDYAAKDQVGQKT